MRVALVSFLLLSACATTEQRTIVWHKVANPHTYCMTQTIKLKEGHSIHGCQWLDSSGICHIATREVSSEKDYLPLVVLGHEVKHCFDGFWHP